MQLKLILFLEGSKNGEKGRVVSGVEYVKVATGVKYA